MKQVIYLGFFTLGICVAALVSDFFRGYSVAMDIFFIGVELLIVVGFSHIEARQQEFINEQQ